MFTTYSGSPASGMPVSCRRRTSSLAPTRLPMRPRPSMAASSAANHASKRPGRFCAARSSSMPWSTRRWPSGFSQWHRNNKMSTACFRVDSCGDTSDRVMPLMHLGCCSASCAPGLLLNNERNALSTSYSCASSASPAGRECSPDKKLDSTCVPLASTKLWSQPMAHVRSVTASDSMCLVVTLPSMNFLMNHSGELRMSTIGAAVAVLAAAVAKRRPRSRSAVCVVRRSLYTSVHFLSIPNSSILCSASLGGAPGPASRSRRLMRSVNIRSTSLSGGRVVRSSGRRASSDCRSAPTSESGSITARSVDMSVRIGVDARSTPEVVLGAASRTGVIVGALVASGFSSATTRRAVCASSC